jgi:hypothetical protein
MEYNFDVSYLLCFSDSASQQLSFLDDKLIFSLQIGYQKTGDLRKKWLKDFDEYKPHITEIVEWL